MCRNSPASQGRATAEVWGHMHDRPLARKHDQMHRPMPQNALYVANKAFTMAVASILGLFDLGGRSPSPGSLPTGLLTAHAFTARFTALSNLQALVALEKPLE